MHSEPKHSPAVTSFSSPFVVVEDFLDGDVADSMRAALEAHFANPESHSPSTHQIWNYWYVPNQYMYLRTQPEKIFPKTLVEKFVAALRMWSVDQLGMSKVSWPYLSLYLNGCRQDLHNDATNGRFAFVYSMTPSSRRTTGGETILLGEGDLVRKYLKQPAAGSAIRHLIEPHFNRLLVFDDRIVHGVERVDGSMDPREARCVLHGHIEEAGPQVRGALSVTTVRDAIQSVFETFLDEATAATQIYQGPLVIRWSITAAGRADQIRIILDRVLSRSAAEIEWRVVRDRLLEILQEARFPASEGETEVTLPVSFGGSLKRGR